MKFIDKSLLRQFVQCQIESEMPIDILFYKDDFFGRVSVVYRFRERKIVRPKYGNQQTAKPMIYHQLIVRCLFLEFIRYFLHISERSFAVFGVVKYGTKAAVLRERIVSVFLLFCIFAARSARLSVVKAEPAGGIMISNGIWF